MAKRAKSSRRGRTKASRGRRPALAEIGLWLLIVGVGAVLLFGGWPGFPWSESEEARVKGLVAVIVAALLVGDVLRSGPRLEGSASWRAFAAALLATGCYLNFGLFHGDRFHHDWEQFHYTLSAKYFDELGYDGLYSASVQAQLERPTAGRAIHRVIRDLRSNEVVETLSAESLARHARVKERFSEARWQDFGDDHDHFVRHVDSNRLASFRLDHGFNAPPSWLFVARSVVGDAPLDGARLDRLGSVDLLLLLVAALALARVFGTRVACWTVALFGTSYLGRFFWVGGALLRQDWWLAVVLSACLLHRHRAFGAGVSLGYAAGVRLFPTLFALGPLVVWAWRSREDAVAARRQAARFAVGLGLSLLALFALGAIAAGDADVWLDYAEVIRLHRGTWLTNNVGLDNLLLHDPETLGRDLVDFRLDEPWTAWQERLDKNRSERAPWIAAVKLLLVAAFLWAVRRRAPSSSFAMSQTLIFMAFLSTCYYWQMLALLPLTGSVLAGLGALAVSVVLWAAHLRWEGFEARYALASILVATVLLLELLRGALRAEADD